VDVLAILERWVELFILHLEERPMASEIDPPVGNLSKVGDSRHRAGFGGGQNASFERPPEDFPIRDVRGNSPQHSKGDYTAKLL